MALLGVERKGMGMGRNQAAKNPQVLGHVSIYQGFQNGVPMFDPHLYGFMGAGGGGVRERGEGTQICP